MPLLNLLNQPIVLVDLFMINITPTIFYFRFIFSVYSTLFFKLILIIFSPGLCSWRYHRWYLAGTQPLVCSVYCFLSCTFAVVIKKKKHCEGYQCSMLLKYLNKCSYIQSSLRAFFLSLSLL